MPILNIFVSFEFDKDDKLRRDFFGQAKTLTRHRVRDRFGTYWAAQQGLLTPG